MKPLFYTIAAIAVLLSLYSLYQFGENLDLYNSISITELKGFQNGNTPPAYIDLRKQFSDKLAFFRNQAEAFQRYSTWTSLGITILTALATLISTINATKEQEMPRRIVLIIAMITFLTTVTNWGQSQLTSTKTGIEKKLQSTKELRTEFMLQYKDAKNDSIRTKTVEIYRDKLEDI